MRCTLLTMVVLTAASCTKQEQPEEIGQAGGCGTPLVINEVLTAGSAVAGDTGELGAWLELYNAGGALHLGAEEWFLTDDHDHLLKFELPSITMREQEHLLIWCDGSGVWQPSVHASFRLAAEGGWVALVHARDGASCIIDSVHCGRQDEGHALSVGRYPDGTQTWMVLALPTPGTANEDGAYDPGN